MGIKKQRFIDWINEVRGSCNKIIKEDLEKCEKLLKQGKGLENSSSLGNYFNLLQEIRDNERDYALLGLIEKMFIEEINNTFPTLKGRVS
jgi:hypothetical protein